MVLVKWCSVCVLYTTTIAELKCWRKAAAAAASALLWAKYRLLLQTADRQTDGREQVGDANPVCTCSPFADGQLLIAMPVTQSALALDCCRCTSPRSPLPTVCRLLFQFSSCVIGHVGGCCCSLCCCSVVLLFCFICHYRVTLTVCVFESKEWFVFWLCFPRSVCYSMVGGGGGSINTQFDFAV